MNEPLVIVIDIYERRRKLAALRKTVLLCFLLLFSISGARSLHAVVTPDERLENNVQRVWQTQDGLPEANVQALAQTRDHYLWIGTTGGLVRFDGQSFVLFNRTNDPAFNVNGIGCLMVARNGDLWIGTGGGGLVRYRNGQFRNYSIGQGFSTNFVRSLLEDRNGRIWIGTYRGLFFLDDDRVVSPKAGTALSSSTILAMVEDRRGAVWVGTTKLIRIENDIETDIPLPSSSNQTTVPSLMITRDDTLWVGVAYHGLLKAQLNNAGLPEHFARVSGITGQVRALRSFPDNSVWIGTISQGNYVYRDGTLRRLVTPAQLPSNAIFSILRDDEENIWFGTQNGVVRLSPTRVSILHLPDAADTDFQTLYADPQGPLWAASTHLFDIQKGSPEQVRLPGLLDARILTLLRDRDGALWLGTNGQGLFHLEHNRLTKVLDNGFVRTLMQTRDGSIWIGTSGELNRWREGKIEKIGRFSFAIHALLEDREGCVWIGSDQGLFRWCNGRLIANTGTKDVQNASVWTLFEDTDGAIWVGTTEQGLFRWKNGTLHHLSATDNFLPSRIFAILQDRNQKYWISSPRGILAIAKDDLNAIAEGSHQTPSIEIYSVTDGLYTTQIFGGAQQTAVLLANGDIWFPGSNGPVRIATTGQQRVTDAPPAVLQKVIVDGNEVQAHRNVDLGSRASRVEIQYGAIDLRPQDQLRFRYKLDGFDEQWIEAGPRRTAYYTNIPPGKYRFRAQVFRLDLPNVNSEVSLMLERQPPFFRTWWFYVCCALLAGLIFWIIHHQRTQRLKERFEAVLEERNRVAREMHDTLVSGCTSVSSLLEALSMTGSVKGESKRTLLDPARQQVSSTIEEARQAIWGLRQNTPPQTDIAGLLREVVSHIEQQSTSPIHYEIIGKPVIIHQEVSHQLLMVTREALFNAVRHGSPTKVRLTVCFDRHQIRIEVEDDGKGFDIPSLTNRDEKRHYGISVMRERIENIDGSFEMMSTPDNGTYLAITAPLVRSHMSGLMDSPHA